MAFILEGPGVAYARDRMQMHRESAVRELDAFPEGATRAALVDLVDYTIAREK
jgi:geranylgeranyl pyrophosphate synthase